MPLLDFLHRVVAKSDLSAAQAFEAMTAILEGEGSTAQVAAFLVALRMKGETQQELLGFARAMRSHAIQVDAGEAETPLLDTCGTGGDARGTFNISTVAAFVAAGAGARVAKHGNRSISSQCGSADVLEALGVRIQLTPEQMGHCLREAGIAFLYAPALHPALRNAMPARLELKMRTVFNLLGPLTNPASASCQLIGAPSIHSAGLMAAALAELGPQRAFVVHADDGLDEISTSGATQVFDVRAGEVREMTVTPGDFGLKEARLEDLRGAGKEENARIARAILEGEQGARRDVVVANAAAALVAAGIAEDFRQGAQRAAASIDSGAALAKLELLAAITQRF